MFPAPPNPHSVAVLILTLVAFFLFTREKIKLETSSLIVLLAVVAGFQIFPFEARGEAIHAVDFFHGFGHEALVAVCALMIVGKGIVRTGALEPVGRVLTKFWKISPLFSLLLTLILSAVISAFINNVPVVVLLLPILISVSVRTGSSPSSVLMPMGFATLLGGTSTTIGTSTNLLVITVAADLGLRRFQMFDFLVPAMIAGGVGLVYLWLIAPRILPKIKTALEDISPREFVAHLEIPQDSSSIGKSLKKAIEKTEDAMQVQGIIREEAHTLVPHGNMVLRAGDRLVVRDTPDRLKEFEGLLEGTLYAESCCDPVNEENPLQAKDQQVAEIAVVEGSRLIGRTVSSIRFADRYGMVILALHRVSKKDEWIKKGVRETRLKAGDVMLVQGASEQLAHLKKDPDFLVLDATADVPLTSKAPIAILIMAGIVGTAALGVMPIAVSSMIGVLLMIVTGCLNWRDATSALSSQVVLIVSASLALGVALQETGGAQYLAEIFVTLAGGLPAWAIVSLLMLLLAFLTNIVSNNAAAVIGTPIAISIALQLGQPPEPFVLAVLFGANMSFATPISYKTNLLVMTAGEYKFNDFLKVGLPLILILWLTLSFVLPGIYGMF
jgi:di/tricarboxylate transporter